MILTFTVPGKPVGKQRPRVGKRGTFTPKETVLYERAVGFCALAERPRGWPLDARYGVLIHAHFTDRRRRDLDNVIKSVLDGLNGVIFADDSQVHAIAASKTIGSDTERTDVMVEVFW